MEFRWEWPPWRRAPARPARGPTSVPAAAPPGPAPAGGMAYHVAGPAAAFLDVPAGTRLTMVMLPKGNAAGGRVRFLIPAEGVGAFIRAVRALERGAARAGTVERELARGG